MRYMYSGRIPTADTFECKSEVYFDPENWPKPDDDRVSFHQKTQKDYSARNDAWDHA